MIHNPDVQVGRQREERITTMLTRIVLSTVLVLGTASATLAAGKHPARHTEPGVQRNVVAPGYAYPGRLAYPGYNAYGAYNAYPGYDAYAFDRQAAREAYDFHSSVSRGETYIWIQDQFFRESN
jgi:hypothetical protein